MRYTILVPFVQFKKREKHPWRSVTFSKVAGFYHVFQVFKIIQMVPNRAKHHIYSIRKMSGESNYDTKINFY